jgi:hypothetical protein
VVCDLFADYQEEIQKIKSGKIYEASQKLGERVYRSLILMAKLKLTVSHTDGKGDLKELMMKITILCMVD